MSWFLYTVIFSYAPTVFLLSLGLAPLIISVILVHRFIAGLRLRKLANVAVATVFVSILLGCSSAMNIQTGLGTCLVLVLSYGTMFLYTWLAIPFYSFEEKKLTLASEKYYSNYVILFPASVITAGTFFFFVNCISR